jgi:hypothetical protein
MVSEMFAGNDWKLIAGTLEPIAKEVRAVESNARSPIVVSWEFGPNVTDVNAAL